MTEPTPVPTPPANPPSPTPPAQPPATPPAPAADGKQPPWGKPENFDADKAWELIQNLRTEKGGADTAALQGQVQQMQQAMEQQRNALATMLGVKPEETSEDKLAEQINGLQKAVLDAERRAVAASTNVPEAMLTATDAEGIRAQAQQLLEFAQAAHYAASAATPPTPPPAFQANPGQGQGNTPLSLEAQEAAEFAKYYPSAS